MKKIRTFAAACCFTAMTAFSAPAEEFGADQLKKMSTFVSNFTELSLFDYQPVNELSDTDRYKLIDFGVRHNDVNNFKSTIKECSDKNCKWGDLVIDKAFVEDSLKRYFDYTFASLPTFDSRDDGFDIYHFDGKRYHFSGAAGEETIYAKVQKAERAADGTILMKGILYNAEEESDVRGTFTVQAKEHEWKGKKTWALLKLETVLKDQ